MIRKIFILIVILTALIFASSCCQKKCKMMKKGCGKKYADSLNPKLVFTLEGQAVNPECTLIYEGKVFISVIGDKAKNADGTLMLLDRHGAV
ncbi:MAG: hypothetical protein ABIA04_09015 [Pseudomonadota bacterium]